MTHKQKLPDTSPVELLHAGATLLAPVLEPAGFAFGERESGVGSGGAFAVGTFSRGSRVLELHVRQTLGIVIYRAGDFAVAHEALMHEAAAGARPRYPGFSDDPLDAFRHLRADLEKFGQLFLRGTDAAFAEQARAGEADAAARRGFRRLS